MLRPPSQYSRKSWMIKNYLFYMALCILITLPLSLYDPLKFSFTFCNHNSFHTQQLFRPRMHEQYHPFHRVTIFGMSDKLPLKQVWKRALRYESIENLKVINVCIKLFRDEDVELLHMLPNGDVFELKFSKRYLSECTEISLGKLAQK